MGIASNNGSKDEEKKTVNKFNTQEFIVNEIVNICLYDYHVSHHLYDHIV